MSYVDQLELLKDLGTFWYSDTSVPQLFERKVLDKFIKENSKSLPNAKELAEIAEQIEHIFSALRTVKKESETCSKIIEPLLDLLGFVEQDGKKRRLLFDEQRTLIEDDTSFIPDYTLFASSPAQNEANRVAEEFYFDHVDLILEAKRIGKDLLNKSINVKSLDDRGNDSISMLSPLSQIRKYVRAANSEYGIVTNGNDWILIAKTSRNYLSTYHIRLSELIQLSKAVEDQSLLLYWWLPFSKYFLLDQNGVRSKSVREETAHFTTSLETDLKKRLTPVVINLLNQIVMNSGDNAYLIGNKETLILDVVRFIYQILYIGCLEDRNLLPVNNPTYRYKFSLKELFEQIVGKSTIKVNFKNGYYVYEYINKLMKLISTGCKDIGKKNSIGEFSVEQVQFKLSPLVKLPDSVLKEIIFQILRFDDESYQQASLRALDTIQFGNIYEHILRLEISYNQRSKKFNIDSNEDSKFERSTAVYTPHHIVEQMVADIVEDYPIASWEDVIKLKIIDPCFGSGHFLIELARQFSQKIIDVISVNEIPINDISKASISEKRQLVQRYLLVNSIYGVDRSEACIDVAKFSIWLSTAMDAQPPLYLDLQLGTGSSLYGETNLKLVPQKDLKILSEIASLRQKIRSKFFKEGAGSKFKRELATIHDQIASHKDNLSDNFSDFNFGYSLIGTKRIDVATRQRPFFWLREFPEVFISGGFSVYATNPPYDQIKRSPSTLKFVLGESELYRLAKMTDLDIKDYTELFDNDKYYKPYQNGYKNLFEGFILLKNKILSHGGFYSLIVPNSILAGAQTKLIRKDVWKDKLRIVREYPEKDSVSRRVFKLRKVACAILYARKINPKVSDSLCFEVYNDANSKIPTSSGTFSFNASLAIDASNVPIVLLDKWQVEILDSLAKFDCHFFREEMIKEGELNESFNQESVKQDPGDGRAEIFGTNRMEFFYFNKYPKQDIVQFCELSKASLTSAKKSDYGKKRLAVNGIAGTNDSRVLASIFIEENTLLNSNINYVLADFAVSFGVEPQFVETLFNSVVFDKLVRIQKRTNHNSSAMIAALPVLKVESGSRNSKMDEDQVLETSNLLKKSANRMIVSRHFHNWMCNSANMVRELGREKNEIIQDILATITTLNDCKIDKINSIARRLDNCSFDPKEIILEIGATGVQASKLKKYFNEKVIQIINIKKLEEAILTSQNFYIAFAIFGSEAKAKEFLGAYKMNTSITTNSLVRG